MTTITEALLYIETNKESLTDVEVLDLSLSILNRVFTNAQVNTIMAELYETLEEAEKINE